MIQQGPTIGFARLIALQLKARCGRKKVDEAAAAAGLPHPLIAEGATTITVRQEAAFVEAAADAAGDIDFGFLAGVTIEVATALPGYIAEHSRTVRHGLVDASKVFPIVRPGVNLTLRELGNVVSFRVILTDAALYSFPRYHEALLAAMIGQIRSFTARPFHPEGLSLRHDRVPVGREARSRLGASVRFGSEQFEMLLGMHVMDRPLRHRDDALHSILVAHAELLDEQTTRQGLKFAEKVELHLIETISDKAADAEATAEALGVSRRTLSRRLMESGTSFTDLAARVRMRRAARELRETEKSVGQIAWQLGYESQSSFSTAFRSKTGFTPREFRSHSAIHRPGEDGMSIERQ